MTTLYSFTKHPPLLCTQNVLHYWSTMCLEQEQAECACAVTSPPSATLATQQTSHGASTVFLIRALFIMQSWPGPSVWKWDMIQHTSRWADKTSYDHISDVYFSHFTVTWLAWLGVVDTSITFYMLYSVCITKSHCG
jgi:hypothetical protein